MSILDWFRRRPTHDSSQKAIAEERLQRVMQGFQAELESMQLPTESAAPGEMPEILSRPIVDYEGDAAAYPWEKQSDDDDAVTEPRRRRY